ncbi:MAG: rod shape-determining protein MreC [Leptothrix sp. (in: b-proteobacteria)]
MPLGTLDRSPPPFFRQGPSALTRLIFFASLALFLMAADGRLGLIGTLRASAAVLLHPVELMLLAPVDATEGVGRYMDGIAAAHRQALDAELRLTRQAERALQVDALLAENTRLRALLDLSQRLALRSRPAEVLYDAADPYSRKIVIDRGEGAGLRRGSPVITDAGVLGQVTRLYPTTAEVTLMIDRDAAIPVLNARTRQRQVAFGDPGHAGMELRFVAANADVQVGDLLVTSGLDGVYPSGLPVATVSALERRTQTDFARIALKPAAQPDGTHHVLVLDPVGEQQAPRPEADAASGAVRGGKDALGNRRAAPGGPRR